MPDRNLPQCNTEEEIALSMGISTERLRFLAFHSSATTYFCFKIPKDADNNRTIFAPMPDLKAAQKWILKNILEKGKIHHAAHGFRHNRSIVTNAMPHVGAAIVIKIDLQDFFQTISYNRVEELFLSFSYSATTATIFGSICTVGNAREKRHLPQGSPASPAISNLICYNLDACLTKIAQKYQFFYTRYADDLTFSGSKTGSIQLSDFIEEILLIIANEGFTVNPNKTQILGKTVQQKVTGIVINKKLNISRRSLKAFRATLYQIEREGLSNKTWGNSDDILAAIAGYASYVSMVNPSKGKQFLEAVERIKQKIKL